VQPVDGRFIAMGGNKSVEYFEMGFNGSSFTSFFQLRNPFVKQIGHLPGHSRLGLSAQTQEKNFVSRQRPFPYRVS
jgi:hypothetical protein